MAQEIKRRLFSSRKVIAVLLALALIGAALLAMTVFAQNDKVTLTISDATGYVGETVWVQISISGIPNVYEVDTGVVGGSFKIPYDASIADVEAMADVRIGALLSTKSRIYPDDPDDLSERDDFIFLSNNKDDGNNKASCAWMSNEFPDGIVRFIRDDGVLARVRFKLKDVGTVDLSFEELTLTDILGENLTSSSITVVPGTITVKSRQLAQVGKPAWDSDVITWTNVENAANYEVQLYNRGVSVDTQTVAQGIAGQQNSHNFGAKIDSLSPGVFTVTVQAKGTDPWTDGDVSEHSVNNAKTATLAQVGKPVWDGWNITWNDDANDLVNVDDYKIKLYRDDSLIVTKTVNPGTKTCDFSADTVAGGSYTATVQAIGDGTVYLDGPVSEKSEPNIRKVKLAQVGQPAWGDPGEISWTAVNHAENYKVELLKDGSVFKTETTTALTCNFLQAMREEGGVGSYTVKVTASAPAGSLYYEDGDASLPSAARSVAKLGQAATISLNEIGVANWSGVTNASGYTVNLYCGSMLIDSHTDNVLAHNFLSKMRENGVGSYTVTVTAMGTGLYLSGDESAPSGSRDIQKLGPVTGLVFAHSGDSGIATWTAPAGAQKYYVQLFKGETGIEAWAELGVANISIPIGMLRGNGAGDYRVGVIAVASEQSLYIDSDEFKSNALTVAHLDAPGNLTWKSDTEPLLTWGNVTGAGSYYVQLYKGGALVGAPVSATDGTTGFDFTALISSAGYYTAKVQAVGSGLNLDSPYSADSPTFTKTGPLGQVTNLTLSDRGVLTWVDEPNADSFVLQLYKEGGDVIGDARTVDPGVQSANFREAMRGAGVGSYYVTVIAKGSGLFTDGPALSSNSQAVSKMEAPVVSFSGTGVSSWGSVDNATQYWVRLYLPAGHPYGQNFQTYWTGSLSLNHLSLMREYPGDYHIGIWAQDIYGLHLDSDESQSETRTVIKPAQVGKPALTDDGNAEWTDVADGVSYEVSLYKGIELVATKTVVLGVQSCTFLDEIKAAGSGIYTVTVTALGDEYLILDGEPSEESDPVTARVLPKMNRPVWAIEGKTGEITLEWEDIEGATGYRIIVYNGNVDEPEVFEVEGTSLTFLPEKPGFYWATVQPLGLGVTLDGPASDRSDVLVSFERGYLNALQQNNSETSYKADGMLPVSGYLWMQITSATGQDGIMTIGRSATSAHAAPEGLTAAGIFFNIELDENLSGSHVILAAGYDPAELPERMDAASLCFYRYDAEKGWMLLKSEVDTTEKLVSAEIAEFSTVGIFGKVSAAPVEPPKDDKPKDDLPRTFGYISYLLLAGLILAAAGMLFFMRRKRLESR